MSHRLSIKDGKTARRQDGKEERSRGVEEWKS
jgi:hypothetical protein